MDTTAKREVIKKEIDRVPENVLKEIEQVMSTWKSDEAKPKRRMRTRDLGGQFDNVDIRKIAYE